MNGIKFNSDWSSAPPTPEEIEELTRDYTDSEIDEINVQIRTERAKLSTKERKAIKDNAQYYERIEGENLYVDGE